MRRRASCLSLVVLLMHPASSALAGAFGEVEKPDETPAPAPASYVETRVRIEDFARNGPYVVVGGVYGFEDFDVRGTAGDWKGSWGYDVRCGYRLNPHLSTEMEWQHFVEFEAPSSSSAAAIESHVLTANARLYPLGGRLQPYLLAGLGWQSASQNRGFEEDGMALRFGAGVDVYITSNVGVAVEGGYVWPVSSHLADAEEVNIIPVNASIFFRFM